MKKKSGRVFLAAVMLAIGMTGCAENEIPDMTQEEIRAVGEYIAITLMKYDSNHRSRLMELSADVEMANPADGDSPTADPEEPSGMGVVDDTPVIDSAGSGSNMASTYSMEEVLGFPEGIKAEFQEYELCGYYPKNSEDSFFTVNASEGNQLLVLRFLVTNTSAEEQNVNLTSAEPGFKVTINGEYSRRTLPIAMLPNNMEILSETLQAGDSVEAVLLIEIVGETTASDILSIRLTVENEGKSCNLTLL